MNDSNQIYFSVLVELLKRHPKTAGLKVKGTAIDLTGDEDLSKAVKAVTAGRTSVNTLRLNSIFEHLGKTATTYTQPLALRPLSIKRVSGFPNGDDDLKWFKDFQDDLDTIAFDKPDNLKANTETLLFVMQKWTSNLSSGCGEDIPFYDMAKLTAAAYICLKQTDNEDKPFLFVSGGVSGIQDYLFDIVSKNAAKNLKGRSFYLHVLVEVILHRIMKDLGVYLTNVVYASGGNYLLLVPNTEGGKIALEKLKRDISDSLFDTHHIGLYTELAWHETDVTTLQTAYKSIGDALSKEISKDKRHKFNRQIMNQFDRLFCPIEKGGETKQDVASREEIPIFSDDVFILGDAHPRLASLEEFEQGDNLVNLKSAYQIKLGFGLKSAKNFYPTEHDKVENRKGYRFPVILGIEPDVDNDLFAYDDYKLQVNNFEFLKETPQYKTHGFQLYGGNDYPETPVRHGSVPKTFSEMAGQKETDEDRDYNPPFKETKFKRLGVLRMDVDGLGGVFRSGLPSIAVHSTLSRNLDWFFKGYLNTLWEKDFAENTQIIYSGGDDLFIVGRWHDLIDFAKKIKDELKDWVLPNKGITISGGLSLVTAKFPVMKAAKYAGEAEDKAKEHQFNGQKKNALSIMGVTMNWDYEFTVVEDLKNKILKYITLPNKALPVSFIFKVNNYYEETLPKKFKNKKEYDAEKKRLEIGKWIWQMAYDLTRMKERCKPSRDESLDTVEFLDTLIQWTIAPKTHPLVSKLNGVQTIERFNFFKLLNFACIWASYELRSKYKLQNGKYVLIKDLPKEE